MASVVVTIKIMPVSPEEDLSAIETQAIAAIDAYVGDSKEKRTVQEPIAFGLKALKITFVMDEKIGSTEPIEQAIAGIEGVNSVDVVDVRRTIG